MKTKWPNLRSLDERMPRWFAPDHVKRIQALCRNIKRRTNMDAWIDTARADVCFGFMAGDGDVRLPMSCKLFHDIYKRFPMKFDPLLDAWHEDSIVYALQLSKVDVRKKKQWAEEQERSRKSDEKSEFDSKIDGHYKEAFKKTERAYEQHSMGRHYRKSVLV